MINNAVLQTRRIQAIDVLRGLIMVLMAIDHVRVYSGLPAGGPEPGIFFTRWITHFCAPGFAFFAGTSAFLYGNRINNQGALSRFLLTRGLLLVLLELTLIRLFWTFNLNLQNFMLAGVIWMLGWCMVLMAALVYVRPKVVGIIGVLIIFLQQAFQFVPAILPDALDKFWEFIYTSGSDGIPGIAILYVIVPWIGVMAAGYGFGTILLLDEAKRTRWCYLIGLSAIALFLIVGSILILSQPTAEDAPPFIFQLLNQKKYPASQLYLLMTLGPLIALVPFADTAKGWTISALKVLGAVPMFYYLMHILVIHLSALLVNLIRTGSTLQEAYVTAPFTNLSEGQWNLPLLYLVFVIDVVILYGLCKWYAAYKMAHPEQKWLKFL